MKRFDLKHTAFHILVALYFIWAFVFAILLAMAISNAIGTRDLALSHVFLVWILTNLLMGSALFVVIRLFRNRTPLSNAILFSYIALGAAALGVMLFVSVKA
jgi:FtsH-binding integral membrane protein